MRPLHAGAHRRPSGRVRIDTVPERRVRFPKFVGKRRGSGGDARRRARVRRPQDVRGATSDDGPPIVRRGGGRSGPPVRAHVPRVPRRPLLRADPRKSRPRRGRTGVVSGHHGARQALHDDRAHGLVGRREDDVARRPGGPEERRSSHGRHRAGGTTEEPGAVESGLGLRGAARRPLVRAPARRAFRFKRNSRQDSPRSAPAPRGASIGYHAQAGHDGRGGRALLRQPTPAARDGPRGPSGSSPGVASALQEDGAP